MNLSLNEFLDLAMGEVGRTSTGASDFMKGLAKDLTHCQVNDEICILSLDQDYRVLSFDSEADRNAPESVVLIPHG